MPHSLKNFSSFTKLGKLLYCRNTQYEENEQNEYFEWHVMGSIVDVAYLMPTSF
jgi:hypothetical protein